MADIVERLRGPAPLHWEAKEAADEITRLRAEVEKLKAAYSATQHDIQQTLGKSLGYPWFKDDQKNFPGATEADGVCVGDHVAESLADEAAAKITALRAEVERLEADLATARADALEEAARVAKEKLGVKDGCKCDECCDACDALAAIRALATASSSKSQSGE